MVSEEQVGQELQPKEDVVTLEQEVNSEALVDEAENDVSEERVDPDTKDQPEDETKADARPSDIEELKAGMRLKGHVRNIVEFGAFIDIGVGRDGLAHISTLQRAGIDKTLKVGDVIDVQIRNVDMERNRISLTIPGAGRGNKKPLEALKSGSEVTGRVVRLVDFGAFVDIGAQTDGLLHISQLSDGYINHPREVVEVGQEVQVRILDIDKERRRISLSMKGTEDEVESGNYQAEPQEDHGPSIFAAAWEEALKDREERR